MIEILKERLKKSYGTSPSKEQVESFARSVGYSCRMYWQQRTDKLHPDDFDLYRYLTNEFCSIDTADKLTPDYKPKYGSVALFVGKYSHALLERELIENIASQLAPETQKNPLIRWLKRFSKK